MKRTKIDLLDIAAFANLALAAVKASRAKRLRPDVQNFFAHFEKNLESLRHIILTGEAPYGEYRRFTVFDPKKRTIHAACFPDRVLHHALINELGPVLEKAMLPFSFACRPGKGPLAAVNWVQRCARRFPWYVKVDIRSYFDSIEHAILKDLLEIRVKGKQTHQLISRIIDSYRDKPGKGLPIGSLTSQHFANYYLDGLDRFILEEIHCCAYARYMDDVIWWNADRRSAKESLKAVEDWLSENRLLNLHDKRQINRGSRGVTFCGYRIFPGTVRLSRRRRKSYSGKRQQWEKAYLKDLIDERQLQSAYASLYAGTAHADSREWRKLELRMFPAIDV